MLYVRGNFTPFTSCDHSIRCTRFKRHVELRHGLALASSWVLRAAGGYSLCRKRIEMLTERDRARIVDTAKRYRVGRALLFGSALSDEADGGDSPVSGLSLATRSRHTLKEPH